jgi:signal peptidase I
MENNNFEQNEEKNKETIDSKLTKREKIKKQLKNFWDLIGFAIIALIVVIPIRMWVIQPFVVSGESMYPTFHNGEYLIIDEISYILGEPKRGDVVVFRYPKDPSRFFIKRIIGMPNERIVIKNGEVTVFNKENPDGLKINEPYIKEEFSTTSIDITEENEYFVMGDNRNRSSDSRSWGILNEKLMIGRALVRLVPVKSFDYLPGSIESFNK